MRKNCVKIRSDTCTRVGYSSKFSRNSSGSLCHYPNNLPPFFKLVYNAKVRKCENDNTSPNPNSKPNTNHNRSRVVIFRTFVAVTPGPFLPGDMIRHLNSLPQKAKAAARWKQLWESFEPSSLSLSSRRESEMREVGRCWRACRMTLTRTSSTLWSNRAETSRNLQLRFELSRLPSTCQQINM